MGKTTQALNIAYRLRVRGACVEYIDEYVKSWAYEKRTPSPIDQIYIAGHQFHREARLLSRDLSHLVTDSPLLLAAIYATYYGGDDDVTRVIEGMVDFLDSRYPYYNVVLKRDDSIFDTETRLQTLEEAKNIDAQVVRALENRYSKKVFILDPNDEDQKRCLISKISQEIDPTG